MKTIWKFIQICAYVICVGLACTAASAEEGLADKVYHLGWFAASAKQSSLSLAQVLGELRRAGFVEGRNLVVEAVFHDAQPDLYQPLANDLVRHKPDLIVVSGTQASLAIQRATSGIPVIVWAVGDPVGTGLVAALAKPGANITGFSLLAGVSSAAKAVQVAREFVPGMSRMAVLEVPTNPVAKEVASLIKASANASTKEVRLFDVLSATDLLPAFRAAKQEGCQVVIVLADTLFLVNRVRVVELAAEYGLPAIYGHVAMAEAGGLYAEGTDFIEMLRGVGTYAARILQGAKPADLPVQQPSRSEIVVNLKTARALPIMVPAAILVRADRVLE